MSIGRSREAALHGKPTSGLEPLTSSLYGLAVMEGPPSTATSAKAHNRALSAVLVHSSKRVMKGAFPDHRIVVVQD
jgi:hypothetical protein